jgi:hypothetical protein
MKRNDKRLHLHRETLIILAAGDNARVAAGYSTDIGGCKSEIAYGCQITSHTQHTCPNNNQ